MNNIAFFAVEGFDVIGLVQWVHFSPVLFGDGDIVEVEGVFGVDVTAY